MSSTQEAIVEFPDYLSTREGLLEPSSWYDEKRKESFVRYDEGGEGGEGYWHVFGYHEANDVLTQPDVYSSEILGESNVAMRDTMLAFDPPEHTERRSAVAECFTPTELEEYEPEIRKRTERLLDDAPSGGFCVVETLAYPLPIFTICDILGIPEEVHHRFKSWSDTTVASPVATGDDEDQLTQAKRGALLETGKYLSEFVDHRSANPRDDLVSEVLRTDHDFTRYELLRLFGLLMIAGNVTTTSLIGNTIRILGERPDVYEALRDDGHTESVEAETVVEEVLRYMSPVQFTTRRATRDVELAGERISEGDPVVIWLGSANRDQRVFDEPDEFRPDRSPNPHMAFGRGIHHCLGAPLARLEARVVLETLVDRIEEFSIAEGDGSLEPTPSLFLHGLDTLVVEAEMGAG